MNNSTYPNNPQEAIFVPVQKCPYHVTFDLDFNLENILDASLPEDHRTIVCKFGRDPAICLREEAMYMYIMYIMYIVTNRLQYFAPASGRSNKNTILIAELIKLYNIAKFCAPLSRSHNNWDKTKFVVLVLSALLVEDQINGVTK